MLQNVLTLSEYIHERNGLPLGAPGSLRAMLHRSFGAGTFSGFWRYWNPIFGYALGRYIYSPLKRWIPPALALVLTFLFCGAIHDLVTILVRGAPAFFFTPLFLFFSLAVLLERAAGLDWSGKPWAVRASINTIYLVVCVLLTLAIGEIGLGAWLVNVNSG